MGKSFIELNGRRYDPHTGELIGDSGLKQAKNSIKESPEVETPIANTGTKPKKPRREHRAAEHAQHHIQQKSQALNRKSVKKPSVAKKPSIKASDSAENKVVKTSDSQLIKKSSAKVDNKRQQRAHLASKSSSVTKFSRSAGSSSSYPVIKASASYAGTQPQAGRTFDITPPPKHAAKAVAMPSAGASKPQTKGQFTKLVENRDLISSHRFLESPGHKSRKTTWINRGYNKVATVTVVGLAISLIAGSVVWQNKNNIQLQLADAKAGISASLPGHVPTGYDVAGFKYQPGLVAIKYESTRDNHYFQLTQKASGYATAPKLAELVTAGETNDLNVYNSAGQKIYISNSGNSAKAAWLSGGILHTIVGNASLSNEQILQIAKSI